jgi:hypothetical protein
VPNRTRLNTTGAPGSPSPLWIIALFIALSEAIAFVAAIGTNGTPQLLFTIFAVAFPLVVLPTFTWLLLKHPGNLYSPAQYTEQTSVESYVGALSRERRDTAAVLKHAASEAVVSVVASDPAQFERRSGTSLRQHVAQTFDQVVHDSSVTVDRSLFDAEDQIQIPVTPSTTVGELLDSIFFALSPAVEPYTYGQSWILADANLASLDELGREWATANKRKQDDRSLSEIGVAPGTTLFAMPEPGPPKPRKPDGTWYGRRSELAARVEKAARADGLAVRKFGPSADRSPHLILSDADAHAEYCVFAMPGRGAWEGWVTLAARASREAKRAEGPERIPVLLTEQAPGKDVLPEAIRQGVRLMWSTGSAVSNAPWRIATADSPNPG